MGPPLAISIQIGIVKAGSVAAANGDRPLKTYRHVVAIPTANGTTQPSSTTGQ
jgi:hypothetical protein